MRCNCPCARPTDTLAAAAATSSRPAAHAAARAGSPRDLPSAARLQRPGPAWTPRHGSPGSTSSNLSSPGWLPCRCCCLPPTSGVRRHGPPASASASSLSSSAHTTPLRESAPGWPCAAPVTCPAAQQEGVFAVVKDWPAIRTALRTQHPRDPRVGRRRRHSRPGSSPPRSVATRVDRACAGRCVPAGWAPIPVGDAGLRISLRRCALPRMGAPASKTRRARREFGARDLGLLGGVAATPHAMEGAHSPAAAGHDDQRCLQLGLLSAALNDLRRRPASQIQRTEGALGASFPWSTTWGRPYRRFLFGRRRPVAPASHTSRKGERWPRVLRAW